MKLILVWLILSFSIIDARYTAPNIKEDEKEEIPTTTDFSVDVSSEETTQSTQNDLNSVDADEEKSAIDIQTDTKNNLGSKQKKHVEDESQLTEKKKCVSNENCLTSKALQLNSPCEISDDEDGENLCEKHVKNSECRKGSCVCKESFVNMDDLICISGKKKLGDACFLRAQCQELTPGSECIKGLCDCHHGILSSNPGEGCIPAKKLGEVCNINQDCSSSKPNSVCSNGKKCVCQKGSITSPAGECILGKNLGEPCNSNVCLDEKAKCTNEKCECKSHYINLDNVCTSEKLLNEACKNNLECTVKHSVCQSGSCLCNSEFLNWENTLCLHGNLSMGDSCSISAQCKSSSVENKIVVCAKPYKSDEESLCLEIPLDMDKSNQPEKGSSKGKKQNKPEKMELGINMKTSSTNYINMDSQTTEEEFGKEELKETSTEITKSKKASPTTEITTTKLLTLTTAIPMVVTTTMKSQSLLGTKPYSIQSNKKNKISNKISTTLPEAIIMETTAVPTSLSLTTTTETLIAPNDDSSKLYENVGPEYEEYEATESPVTWKIVKPTNNHYGSHQSQLTKQDNNLDVAPLSQTNHEMSTINSLDSSSLTLYNTASQPNNEIKDNKHLENNEISDNSQKIAQGKSKSSPTGNIASTSASSVDTNDDKISSSTQEKNNNRHPMLGPNVPNKGLKSQNNQVVNTYPLKSPNTYSLSTIYPKMKEMYD